MKKIIANNKNIIRSVDNNLDRTFFSTANIKVKAGFNTGASPRWLKYDFGAVQDKVIVNKRWGENSFKMLIFENVSSITLNGTPNEDGNGDNQGNANGLNYDLHIWLSNPKDITHMRWSSNSSNNRVAWLKLQLDESFINLEYFSAIRVDSLSNTSSNQCKISHLPKIKYIIFQSDNPTNINNLRLNESTSIKVYKDLRTRVNEVNWIYGSLKYLNCRFSNPRAHYDLGAFFNNGERAFLNIGSYTDGTTSGNALYGMRYNGNAIFPKHIFDTDITLELPQYIIFLADNEYLVEPLTPDELAQFIIDFANQVESVDVVHKKIRFQDSIINTSYEDLSQPLFKTYASALNHITTTLGITVTFT